MVTTVPVTTVEGHHALLMRWGSAPEKRDVRDAFKTMTESLNASSVPLRVIVDVSSDPRFPLSETISGAFWGPFRNRMLTEWLVVGASGMAHTIGRALIGMSRRDNIRWFDTMDDAMSYLAGTEAEAGTPL